MTSKQTELGLPWKVEAGNPFWERGPAIINNQGIRIAYIEGAPLIPHDKDETHAAFILTAANLHHELLNILECVAGDYEERGITGYILEFIKAAIAKAKEA